MSTADRFQRWFRSKREEILVRSAQAQDHPGLVGSHRESAVREFLGELLPSRLGVERGIVYSPLHRSGECDVVIWDKANYPRLSLIDHSSFLIESVSLVIEVKSQYSRDALRQCFERCSQLRNMSMHPGTPELLMDWRVDALEERVAALEWGQRVSGSMIVHPRVGYGVLFLEGGDSLDIDDFLSALGDEYDFDDVPSFATFLRPGKFFRRFEPSMADIDEGEVPIISRFECGEDVLGETSDEVLRLVRLRTPALTAVWDLSAYRGKFAPDPPAEERELQLTRFPFGRRPYYEPLPPVPEN
jgi:hypothetical protein